MWHLIYCSLCVRFLLAPPFIPTQVWFSQVSYGGLYFDTVGPCDQITVPTPGLFYLTVLSHLHHATSITLRTCLSQSRSCLALPYLSTRPHFHPKVDFLRALTLAAAEQFPFPSGCPVSCDTDQAAPELHTQWREGRIVLASMPTDDHRSDCECAPSPVCKPGAALLLLSHPAFMLCPGDSRKHMFFCVFW